MPLMITRHYLTVNGRRVHYRKCGEGPPLLMVHQSPRSSAEYEDLMRAWGAAFTCIAPDTAGFGQSDPLPMLQPEINNYADSIVEFVGALGLPQIAAYGFHSGGIILVTALKRHPKLFTGLAVGGYAIWTPEEMAIFGESYIPHFVPSAYGEHLVWLWNRILEQTWFFPWFDTSAETRLSGAHDDPVRTDAVVREMLDAGDAYRLGYGAVLRAPRDIPTPDAITPPVLITAYDGDPLQTHLNRLGTMPAGWESYAVKTPKAHQDASLTFLKVYPGPSLATYPEDANQGFLHIATPDFDGLIHWRGARGAAQLHIHAPGSECGEFPMADGLAIDLPGHGLSSRWLGKAPTDRAHWQAVIDATALALGASEVVYARLPNGDADRLFPPLAPDRFGAYLTTAWGIIRARLFYAPWYEATAANAIAFDLSSLAPATLAREHRALIRSTAAREMLLAFRSTGD